MFLTREEIEALTGRIRPSAQIRWLRQNGLETLRRADGQPLVLRAALIRKLGVDDRHHRIETKPDWSVFKNG
jgi:hypothetical protein